MVWLCSSRSHFSLAGSCCSAAAVMTVVWKLTYRQKYELGSGPFTVTAKCCPCFCKRMCFKLFKETLLQLDNRIGELAVLQTVDT